MVNPAEVELEEIKTAQEMAVETDKVVSLTPENSPAQVSNTPVKEVEDTVPMSSPVEGTQASQGVSDDSLSKDIAKAAQEVSDYVTKIIYEMDIEVSIETSNNRRQINLQIETPEAGRVIGYHGKVLKSLQLLAQNFLHDRYSKNFSVSLNVHDYVEHRTEILIDFTQKVAKRVLESGQDYTMDPMSNSERKIVHKTVSTIRGVDSYSEGNDPNRYVVVTLSE